MRVGVGWGEPDKAVQPAKKRQPTKKSQRLTGEKKASIGDMTPRKRYNPTFDYTACPNDSATETVATGYFSQELLYVHHTHAVIHQRGYLCYMLILPAGAGFYQIAS